MPTQGGSRPGLFSWCFFSTALHHSPLCLPFSLWTPISLSSYFPSPPFSALLLRLKKELWIALPRSYLTVRVEFWVAVPRRPSTKWTGLVLETSSSSHSAHLHVLSVQSWPNLGERVDKLKRVIHSNYLILSYLGENVLINTSVLLILRIHQKTHQHCAVWLNFESQARGRNVLWNVTGGFSGGAQLVGTGSPSLFWWQLYALGVPHIAWEGTPVLVSSGPEQPRLLGLTSYAQMLDFKNKIFLSRYLRLWKRF